MFFCWNRYFKGVRWCRGCKYFGFSSGVGLVAQF